MSYLDGGRTWGLGQPALTDPAHCTPCNPHTSGANPAESGAQCGPGYRCAPVGESGVARAEGLAQHTCVRVNCSTHYECCGGYNCVGGQCTKPDPTDPKPTPDGKPPPCNEPMKGDVFRMRVSGVCQNPLTIPDEQFKPTSPEEERLLKARYYQVRDPSVGRLGTDLDRAEVQAYLTIRNSGSAQRKEYFSLWLKTLQNLSQLYKRLQVVWNRLTIEGDHANAAKIAAEGKVLSAKIEQILVLLTYVRQVEILETGEGIQFTGRITTHDRVVRERSVQGLGEPLTAVAIGTLIVLGAAVVLGTAYGVKEMYIDTVERTSVENISAQKRSALLDRLETCRDKALATTCAAVADKEACIKRQCKGEEQDVLDNPLSKIRKEVADDQAKGIVSSFKTVLTVGLVGYGAFLAIPILRDYFEKKVSQTPGRTRRA